MRVHLQMSGLKHNLQILCCVNKCNVGQRYFDNLRFAYLSDLKRGAKRPNVVKL